MVQELVCWKKALTHSICGGGHCGDCCDTGCSSGHCGDQGCGEPYHGAWHDDPSDCCEPCDHHGNWTGPHYSRRMPPAPIYSEQVQADGEVVAKQPSKAIATTARRPSR
jgi:hypothetical protein